MSPFSRVFLVFGLGSLLLPACKREAIQYPAVPPPTVTASSPPVESKDYTQTLAQDRNLKKRLAIARLNDTIPVDESPFGEKREVDIVGRNVHVHRETVVPEKVATTALFTEKLIDALARTNRFILIERKDINSILRELSFGEAKWVDKKSSEKAGAVLGAQIIITGSYGRNQDSTSSRTSPNVLYLRMYDVGTSRIVGTAKAMGNGEDELIERGVWELIGRMDKVPWVGRVASVAGSELYLNAGKSANIKIGDTFQIFSLGEPIRDPGTREVIGYREKEAGKAEVTSVDTEVSTMKLLSKSRAIKVGDNVRYQEAATAL